MLNDPKYDDYAVPVELLKHARKLIKQGATREQAAGAVVDLLEKAIELQPESVKDLPLIQLDNCLMQYILVLERLKIVDPECEESEGWTRLLNRIRGREHDKRRRKDLSEEELERRRRYHTEYMRERRKNDPKILEEGRRASREHYRKRRDTDPEAHAAYLEEKRQQRIKDKADPVKAQRFQKHAKKSWKQRQERYHSDPEYRADQQAAARARYHMSRARKRREAEDAANAV